MISMRAWSPKKERHLTPPEELFSSKSLGDQITKVLQEVPEDYRTAVVLVDIEELTYEEAAKVMECPCRHGTLQSIEGKAFISGRIERLRGRTGPEYGLDAKRACGMHEAVIPRFFWGIFPAAPGLGSYDTQHI